MKNLFLITSILICCFVNAQNSTVANPNVKPLKVGIKTGINIANLTNTDEPGISSSSRIGFNLGVYLNYKFSDKLGFQPEVLYTTQGNVLKGSSDGMDLKMTFMLDYIAIPLMIKYYPAKNFNLEFGPQLAFNVNKKVKAESGGETVTIDLDELFAASGLDSKTNTFDFGLNFGMSYELGNGLNFNGRYSLGMIKVFEGSDVVKSDGSPQNIKNSVFSFGLGYTFK